MKYSRVVATPLLANSGQRPLYGEQIEDFLNFLRKVKTDYNIAVSSEKEANDATQDLLHSLELYENTYRGTKIGGCEPQPVCKANFREYARAAKKLAQVRQERRAAKDMREQLRPIMDWLGENDRVIYGLENLLGNVRKAERSTEGRFYTPKTDVLDGINREEAAE